MTPDPTTQPRGPHLAPCGICGWLAPAEPEAEESICDPCWEAGIKDGIFEPGPNPCKPGVSA